MSKPSPEAMEAARRFCMSCGEEPPSIDEAAAWFDAFARAAVERELEGCAEIVEKTSEESSCKRAAERIRDIEGNNGVL